MLRYAVSKPPFAGNSLCAVDVKDTGAFYVDQPWMKIQLRKATECRLCKRVLVVGEKAWRPIDNGLNRMRRLCVKCIEGEDTMASNATKKAKKRKTAPVLGSRGSSISPTDQVKDLVSHLTSPSKMAREEYRDFLADIVDDLQGRLDAVIDELNAEERVVG